MRLCVRPAFDLYPPVIIKHGCTAFTVGFDPSRSVKELKDLFHRVTGVPSNRMKVVAAGKLLGEDCRLDDVALAPSHTITVIGTAKTLPIGPTQPIVFVEDLPEHLLSSERRPLGLQNLGSTCYMNSSLQAIRTIPELDVALQEFKSSASSGEENLDAALTGSLKNLFEMTRNPTVTQECAVPLEAITALRQVAPQFQEKDQHGEYAMQGELFIVCEWNMPWRKTFDSG